MKTEWDYTQLAKAYLKRADYSTEALQALFAKVGLNAHSTVCDIGAGVAHLTIPLAKQKVKVTAVEPNDAMRQLGKERTAQFSNVTWYEGTGEDTKQKDHTFDVATFGSSFNVTDRALALKEVKRILKPKGWVAMMWNHRDLKDPIQAKIESIIKSDIPTYAYGTRREDPTEVIDESHFFGHVKAIEGLVDFMQSKADMLEAWRSHGTLHRQAGEKFDKVIGEIAKYLESLPGNEVKVPYVTKIWTAQLLT